MDSCFGIVDNDQLQVSGEQRSWYYYIVFILSFPLISTYIICICTQMDFPLHAVYIVIFSYDLHCPSERIQL